MTQPIVGSRSGPHPTHWPAPPKDVPEGQISQDPYLDDTWNTSPDVIPRPEGTAKGPNEGSLMRAFQVSVPGLRGAEEAIGVQVKYAAGVYNSLRALAEADVDFGQNLQLQIPVQHDGVSGSTTGPILDTTDTTNAAGFRKIDDAALKFHDKITNAEQPLLQGVAQVIALADQFREAIQVSLQDYASADAHSTFPAP